MTRSRRSEFSTIHSQPFTRSLGTFETHHQESLEPSPQERVVATGNDLEPNSPLGYKNGQLLLGFAHNIPNNTLPIFWSDGRQHSPWTPLFPRYRKGPKLVSESVDPFAALKATELGDTEIESLFVDFEKESSLLVRLQPKAHTPMVLLGAKGSGKTHLMRYLSLPLQLARHRTPEAPLRSLATDGYIGIYFRCSGLNARRFQKKGQPADTWEAVFAYYMELWFVQLVLDSILQVWVPTTAEESQVIHDVLQLIDIVPEPPPETLPDLRAHFRSLQREADVAINNCPLTGNLDLRIAATPGSLVFGLPRILHHLSGFAPLVFVYLIDEFENLTKPQQRYINTLIRERQAPCTLKVGVRPYGFKTKETMSAGEGDSRELRVQRPCDWNKIFAVVATRPSSDSLRTLYPNGCGRPAFLLRPTLPQHSKLRRPWIDRAPQTRSLRSISGGSQTN